VATSVALVEGSHMTIHEPGWYPDPSNPSIQRYFNGTEWTDLPAPPPMAAGSSNAVPSSQAPSQIVGGDSRTVLCWAVVAGGALLSIGTLFAWMTASAGIISVSRNAFQMGAHESVTADGPIVLILGLIILGIGITRLTNTSSARRSSPAWAPRSFSATTTTRYSSGRNQSTAPTHSLQSVQVFGCAASVMGSRFWLELRFVVPQSRRADSQECAARIMTQTLSFDVEAMLW